MTGTALTEVKEFSEIYKLKVAEVPTNRPLNREDSTDVVFRSLSGTSQFRARLCMLSVNRSARFTSSRWLRFHYIGFETARLHRHCPLRSSSNPVSGTSTAGKGSRAA